MIISSLNAYDIELRGYYNPTLIFGDIQIFDGPVDCGDYTNQRIGANSFGLINRFKLHKNLGINLFANYKNVSGEYYKEDLFISRNDINFELDEVSTKTSLNYDLSNFELGVGGTYFLDEFLLGSARIDLNIGFALPISGDFNQTEEIQSPDNAVFTQYNNTQTRNFFNDEINNLTNQIFVGSNFSNNIKLTENLYFTQTFGVNYYVNSLFEGIDNSYVAYNLGVGLLFSKERKIEEKPVIPIETPVPKPFKKVETIVNKEIPKKEVEFSFEVFSNWEDSELEKGEELLATTPIVNSLFFERNSSEILGQNYDNKFDKFSEDAITAHSFLLLRLSDILKKNPNSSILINAYTAGNDIEPLGLELAKKRTQEIEEKLIELGVDENKIEKQAAILPKNPSNNLFEKGDEENQRADLILNNANTQEYLSFNQFQQLNGEINVKVNVKNNTQELKLINSLADSTISISNSDDYKFSINKRLSQKSNVESITKLIYKDSVLTDNEFIDLKNLSSINVNYDLSRFEAILRFNYNSYNLSNENKELLKQLVEILPENSKIQILGSADASGSQEANKILEEQRAKVTKEFLEGLNNKNFIFETGRSENKFPEETPQGRFLNRSIRIKVSR